MKTYYYHNIFLNFSKNLLQNHAHLVTFVEYVTWAVFQLLMRIEHLVKDRVSLFEESRVKHRLYHPTRISAL